MRSLPVLTDIEPARTGLAKVLLHEVQTALLQYEDGAAAHTIDLRSLPLTPRDREELDQLLGKGEVQATLDVAGPSEVWETRYCGVWRVVHRDAQGAVVAETLEVTVVPEVLCSPREDFALSAARLAQALEQTSAQSLVQPSVPGPVGEQRS